MKQETPTPACIDASWTTKQSRALNSYKQTGNNNVFNKHCDFLKSKGCNIDYIFTCGNSSKGYYRVSLG